MIIIREHGTIDHCSLKIYSIRVLIHIHTTEVGSVRQGDPIAYVVSV
jgi:hypothetical protein